MLRDDKSIENVKYWHVITYGAMEIVYLTHVQTIETRCSFHHHSSPHHRFYVHHHFSPLLSSPLNAWVRGKLWSSVQGLGGQVITRFPPTRNY